MGIYLLIFVCFFSSSFAHCLLFVHLGKDVPRCIFTTMKQARYLNQDCPIYLLTDRESYPIFQQDHLEFFAQERISLVDMGSIPLSNEHRVFREVNKINDGISNGFWFYATERFFVLFDFFKEMDLKDAIHLESDSMIYIDLNELIPSFKMLNIRLAAPFQSLVGCIPCFVFIRDQESLCLLIRHILSEMKNYRGVRPHIYVNDMQTLASFYKKFGSDWLIPLPTLMAEYCEPKRKSLFVPDNRTPLNFLSMYASVFPGYIFDAAGLAIFMNGNDRKFSPTHEAGTIHSRSLFDPSFFDFFWEKDRQGRKIPYLKYRGNTYQIINLHFHSKMPEDYTSF